MVKIFYGKTRCSETKSLIVQCIIEQLGFCSYTVGVLKIWLLK